MANMIETLALAGGCFWCTDAVFRRVRGVVAVECGYSNGQATQPSYEEVCTGATGCAEVVRIEHDPALVDTRTLLEIFFATHDPTTPNRQGADVGTQYRSGVYWTLPAQAEVARALIAELDAQGAFGAPIVTEVEPLRHYWPAEAYHQDYFARHPHQGYCQVVIAPKVAKLRRRFAHLLQPEGA
ncbi:MAG: peptide-methionine (S)-S-oxide reductase MsrA [Tepidimonas ignava]|uniref:Peptide methionine sulfoxide reductase MsrA n=1 Tax=Tepidimonas ignava TaxID=114249 RepID=A0A4R3LAW5_9BURK|nr:peptide-methionine (S)-S-oxide reductase MsrA [Tepidimonas ignava]MCX7815431.1 peptide-methionine (S)-S-oxide reductase MsrA [Tepidimonas ignava]TCS97281.1 peptide-methionine (S)-S-oxide reductase [Tepidimonas ignava]TSE21267.1 Peptide methionine sulfoxide reductase MsrA [Tepidimonas ignava]